jgi:DNA repair photolyase
MARFTVHEIHCKSAINAVKGMPFSWSLNPYRGCRHACVYCYARPTHEYLGLDARDGFQEVILAKVNAPEIVRKELARPNWRGENVVVGTATDPYQQAESRYGITRGILEAFREARNPVSITTKSPMVLRDLDILSDLARHVTVTVHFTVTTLDETLWRAIEPTTSKPKKRLEALRTLRDHGIHAGVFLSPVLPGLTDDEAHLEAVIVAAAEAGAEFVFSQALRLGPGISEYYLPWLERTFPHLTHEYERLYRRNFPPAYYADTVTERVRALKRKHGLRDRMPEIKVERAAPPVVPVQLGLFAP